MGQLPFEVKVDLVGWVLFWAELEQRPGGAMELARLRETVAAGVSSRHARRALTEYPPVAALRKLFRATGCDPTRYRPSSEALLRRLRKGAQRAELATELEFKSLFYKAPAKVNLTLGWPGGPAQYSAAELEGDIGVEVGAGSLLEVEPGVGRMLGILNLQALQRRLNLDFSDIFERGYAFEKISGNLKVGGGRAEIEELLGSRVHRGREADRVGRRGRHVMLGLFAISQAFLLPVERD